mgnify:CR=1 FL=1
MADPAATSVVIPAFNEAASIASVVGDLRSAGSWNEILVVDDGSTDDTGARASAGGATVIRHPYNKGNGAAVKTGIRHATGACVLIVDGDGQHRPADAVKLVAQLDDYDLVVGARSTGSAGHGRAADRQRLPQLDGELSDRAADSRSHVGISRGAARTAARVPAPAAEWVLDADHDHARVHQSGIQCALRAGRGAAARGRARRSASARTASVFCSSCSK